jgi:PadR family transcriptional regulator AphA
MASRRYVNETGYRHMNVRTLCLGILAFKEASGYEIKKAVEDGMFSHFIEASYGSIYPALTHMLADGLVSVREQVQEGKPLKKAYSITDAGRKALRNALHEIPQQDKYKSEFLFQALFRNQVDAKHLEDVFEGQLQFLYGELANIEQCSESIDADSGHAFVNGYGRAVIAAAIQYMEESRSSLGLPQKATTSDAAE